METLVYDNDFETQDVSGLWRGEIVNFRGNNMLGFFNRSGFTLGLINLPSHNYIEVSFDLYTLDSWDGNADNEDGPDFWEMKVDGASYLRTTFRNRPCVGRDCPAQSYPGSYPSVNYPRTGAEPGITYGGCVLNQEPDGAAHYRIVRLIPHTSDEFRLDIDDQLKQDDVAPANRGCDESWTLDNLKIKAVSIN
jgi:hypothetical protein